MGICTKTMVGGFSDSPPVPVLSDYAYQKALPLVPAYLRPGDAILPGRFAAEASASLPGLDQAQAFRPENVLAAMALQRMWLRQDQGVPEWKWMSDIAAQNKAMCLSRSPDFNPRANFMIRLQGNAVALYANYSLASWCSCHAGK